MKPQKTYEGPRPEQRLIAHYNRLVEAFLEEALDHAHVTRLEGNPPVKRNPDGTRTYSRTLITTPVEGELPDRHAAIENLLTQGGTWVPKGKLKKIAPPILRTNVQAARIQHHNDHVSRWKDGAAIRNELHRRTQQLERRYVALLQEGSGGPPVREIEVELSEVRSCREELAKEDRVRIRWSVPRDFVLVYYASTDKRETLYIPKTSAVLIGPSITTEFASAFRARRKDRIQATPSCVWRGRELFREAVWNKATKNTTHKTT